MYQWRTGRSCVFKNNIHLIFVTKYRKGVLTKEMIDRLSIIFSETCLQMDCELLEFNGEDDHVHLMVSVHPKLAVSNLVGKLKGKSSYILRKYFLKSIRTKLWGNRFWSPSYCVVSVGGATLDVLKKYIQDQRTPSADKHIKKSISLSHPSKRASTA